MQLIGVIGITLWRKFWLAPLLVFLGVYADVAAPMYQAELSKSALRSLVVTTSDRRKKLARGFALDMPENLPLMLTHFLKIEAMLNGFFDDFLVLFMMVIPLLKLLTRDSGVGLENASHEAHVLCVYGLRLFSLEYYAQRSDGREVRSDHIIVNHALFAEVFFAHLYVEQFLCQVFVDLEYLIAFLSLVELL